MEIETNSYIGKQTYLDNYLLDGGQIYYAIMPKEDKLSLPVGDSGAYVPHALFTSQDSNLIVDYTDNAVVIGTNSNDNLESGVGLTSIFGLKGDDIITSKNTTTEIYAGDGADTLLGGTADDHHVPGNGDDVMQDAGGNDRYYIGFDEGHDSITDTDSRGEIWYNAVPVTGIAQEDTNNTGVRWTLERNDGVSFIMTRTGYGVQTSMGSDLKITIGGSLATSTQSITLRHFPFAEQQGLGIVLDKVSNINATDASNALRASLSSLTPQAISWGDPHLVTSDGLKYDFQQRGEYVLLDSPGDGYQLQVRQEKWDKNPKVSVNTALATELNGTKVMIKPVGNVATPTPTPPSSSTTGVFDSPVPLWHGYLHQHTVCVPL